MFIRRIVFLCAFFLFNSAHSLKIEINKGVVEPDPIAIVDFFSNNGSDSKTGTEISNIIKNNLELSGLFLPLDSRMFIESKQTLATSGHNIKNWNVLKARFLVYGNIEEHGFQFTVRFKLVDVVTGEIMLSLDISGDNNKKREIAHIISDYIYERITSEEGYFNTHLIVVESATKAGTQRKTKLVKIDQDGYNPIDLTHGDELVLMARYSNDGKNIAFISYKDKGKGALGKSAHVYIMNLSNKSTRLLLNESIMKELIKKNRGNPVQMTYAPRFSNDGSKAVLAIIIDGKSAIYTLDIKSNTLKQLTEHTNIDTSPCFSNDDSKIVFTSNRSGKEAIYVMNTDGSNQTRISKGEGKYSQPVWSPRGDLIAFAKQTGGHFYIGLMKPNGSDERLIIDGYLVEAPCWASNGRYISYSSQSGPGQKTTTNITDITGHHTRMIETKGDAAYPAWSPRRKLISK